MTNPVLKQAFDKSLSVTSHISIRDISEQLNSIIKNEWNSIPESVFVQEFLDMFADGVDKHEVAFQNWIKVAGNLRFGVHVYKDDTKEHLFTVPPIYDTAIISATPSNERTGDTIATHAVVYEQLLRSRPTLAQAYFKKNMFAVLKSKITKRSENWTTFFEILKKYGRLPGEEKNNSGNQMTKQSEIVYSDEDIL